MPLESEEGDTARQNPKALPWVTAIPVLDSGAIIATCERNNPNVSIGRLPDVSVRCDYRAYLHRYSRQLTISQNEFDLYIESPPSVKKIKTLEYWKNHISDFPRLKLMIRDTYAVPATGAGVERMCSRSGRVATWSRARLNGIRITETMLCKEFLDRIGQPLDAERVELRGERRRRRIQNGR